MDKESKEAVSYTHLDVYKRQVCYGLWVDPNLAKNHGVFVSSRATPDKLDFMVNQTLKASRVKFNNSILSSTNKTVNFLLPNSETEVTSSPTPTKMCIRDS